MYLYFPKSAVLNLLIARYCRSLRFAFAHFIPRFPDFTRPQIRCLGLLTSTRFSISFRIFILKILHFINLVHKAVRSSISQTRLHSRQNSLSWIYLSLDTVIRYRFTYAHFVPRFPDFIRPQIRYAMILSTTPAPTVRPPSLIANLIPCSIATGAINSTSITTLSPGITISPSNLIEPVTSVVLM